MKSKLFNCRCGTLEHVLRVTYDPDERCCKPDLWIEVLLYKHSSFWLRVWVGIKYIFGHVSDYGNFSEFIVKKQDAKELREFFDEYLAHLDAWEPFTFEEKAAVYNFLKGRTPELNGKNE